MHQCFFVRGGWFCETIAGDIHNYCLSAHHFDRTDDSICRSWVMSPDDMAPKKSFYGEEKTCIVAQSTCISLGREAGTD